MTTTETIRVSREWLDLREGADASARSRELVALLLPRLPAGRLVVHDLGSGSGSMGRWLAPLLPHPQDWILHDRDPDLLALAAGGVETRLDDITQLSPSDLADADLITASALLDLLTRDELIALAQTCTRVACPVLLTLSVTGSVQLFPPEPLDARIATSFNAHQRRATSRGRLLGPDAGKVAADTFHGLGREVVERPSPWRLAGDRTELIAQWFGGWVDAACEQEPGLAAEAHHYRDRRLRETEVGRLTVSVGHTDLLVLS